jgi:type II secretory ATPase GspE/PulE/Tfp pilus assembly ATPase PilB-like protein
MIYGQDKERQYLQRISESTPQASGPLGPSGCPGRCHQCHRLRFAVHNVLRLEESALKLQEQIDAVQQTTETTETTETCELKDGQSLEKAVRDLPSTKIIPCSK